VTLFEATEVLGGSWAPRALPGSDLLVDDAPAVTGFPAPWRDLFRKSGRPLEAELARAGYALVPAAPPRYRFADGSELVLPTDRGEQHAVLVRAYGPAVAARWRDLLDGLDGVWQALRPLGLESAFDRADLRREVRRRLWSRRTVADLAERLGDPRPAALVRSVAHRQGSAPGRTPALAAVDLMVARTFGRWQVEPLAGGPGDPGRSSVLTELLAQRLALRRVDVRTGRPVSRVDRRDGGGFAVAVGPDEVPVDAVVLAVDPWSAAALAPGLRPPSRRIAPALGPVVRHAPTGSATGGVEETVALDESGVPVVTYARPAGDAGLESVHDFRRGVPRPGSGVAAAGFRSWARRPGTTTAVPGLVLAGPAPAAEVDASRLVLSGALASYALSGRER
jgi:UDP-galactopyranose mutase